MEQKQIVVFRNWVVNFIIISLAITPTIALGAGNKNLFLIAIMLLSPILLLYKPVFLPKIDLPLIIFLSFLIGFPMCLHPSSVRWSTLGYSSIFCLYFMFYARVLYQSNYKADVFLRVLKWIIYAYCIVLIIQQVCVLLGLPIFNLGNYNPREPFKLNSLMPEPSHTARAIILFMFMYLLLVERIHKLSTIQELYHTIDKKVMFACLYPIITMGSGTGFLFLFIILSRYIPKKRILQLVGISVFLLPLIYWGSKHIYSLKRSTDFIEMMIHFDEKTLIQKDLSAAIRIIPTLNGLRHMNVYTIDGLFGHGVDADTGLTPLPSVDCGAGSFSIWYNFGFFTALLFWFFTFRICFLKHEVFLSTFFWFMLCFFYGRVNDQMIWLTLAIFLTFKYVMRNERNMG